MKTPCNIERVREIVTQSPHRSALRHAAALRLSDRSFRQILHLDLKFHPYKIAIVHQILDKDYESRKLFSEIMLGKLNDETILVMSDEAHFHLSGCVNKQNFRYWAQENFRQLHKRPLHLCNSLVWCF